MAVLDFRGRRSPLRPGDRVVNDIRLEKKTHFLLMNSAKIVPPPNMFVPSSTSSQLFCRTVRKLSLAARFFKVLHKWQPLWIFHLLKRKLFNIHFILAE